MSYPDPVDALLNRRLAPRVVSPALADRVRCDGDGCGCEDCHPEWFPQATTQAGERYFDARCGDTRARYPRLAVTIDGESCGRVALRSYAGDPGWVDVIRLMDDRMHLCRNCGWGICQARLTGVVTVTL